MVRERYRYRYLKNLVGPKKVPVPEKAGSEGQRKREADILAEPCSVENIDISRLQKCQYYRGKLASKILFVVETTTVSD